MDLLQNWSDWSRDGTLVVCHKIGRKSGLRRQMRYKPYTALHAQFSTPHFELHRMKKSIINITKKSQTLEEHKKSKTKSAINFDTKDVIRLWSYTSEQHFCLLLNLKLSRPLLPLETQNNNIRQHSEVIIYKIWIITAQIFGVIR